MVKKREHDSKKTPFLENMNWDLLKRFMICASCKSFSEAKEKIGTSGSALAKQMDELERSLGIMLFERSNEYRSNQLTHQGEMYFNYIKEVYYHLEALHSNIKRKKNNKLSLKVVTTPGLAEHVLAPLIVEYIKYFPNVDLIIQAEPFTRKINEDEILIRSDLPSQERIEKKFLFRHELNLYASDEYIREHGNPERLTDLVEHTMLTLDGGAARNINKGSLFLTKLDLLPKVSSNSINLLYKICESGLGILELPDIFVGTKRLNKVVNKEPSSTTDVHMAYHPELKSVAHAKSFIDILNNKLNK